MGCRQTAAISAISWAMFSGKYLTNFQPWCMDGSEQFDQAWDGARSPRSREEWGGARSSSTGDYGAEDANDGDGAWGAGCDHFVVEPWAGDSLTRDQFDPAPLPSYSGRRGATRSKSIWTSGIRSGQGRASRHSQMGAPATYSDAPSSTVWVCHWAGGAVNQGRAGVIHKELGHFSMALWGKRRIAKLTRDVLLSDPKGSRAAGSVKSGRPPPPENTARFAPGCSRRGGLRLYAAASRGDTAWSSRPNLWRIYNGLESFLIFTAHVRTGTWPRAPLSSHDRDGMGFTCVFLWWRG